MFILPDSEIRKFVLRHKMIDPFIDYQSQKGVVSYGLSSFGYDVRISNKFSYTAYPVTGLIDPKKNNLKNFNIESSEFIIPGHSSVMACSIEYFSVPENMLVLCLGKSTYARCGLLVNATPLEPGWKGYITLKLSNTTSFPIKIYGNEGVCQLIFFLASVGCDVSYKNRDGKYVFQEGAVYSKIFE